MYSITEEQVEFILQDIRSRGIETEDLQNNILDHVCCIIENELTDPSDFKSFYEKIITRFYKNDIKEIEQEATLLLTYKNYYKMKKLLIASGAVSAFLFTSFSFFKIMHWPTANMQLLIAVFIFAFIFLPLVVMLKVREQGEKRDKLILSLGIVAAILYTVATMFTIFHWKGNMILWFSTLLFSFFLFIPTYFFTGIRQPDKKFNTIIMSVIMVAMVGLMFTMMRVH